MAISLGSMENTSSDWMDITLRTAWTMASFQLSTSTPRSFRNTQTRPSIKHQVPDFDVFERAVREHTAIQNVRWLRQDESYVICEERGGGIECSIHGHEGVNGAKGSPRGYRGLGIRLNTDHTHSPGIIGGIYTGGVNGAKAMGYNRGAGSWSHSDIITYANSKRTILTKRIGKDGTVKWRAKPRIRVRAIGRALGS